jgi:hypothetical protein
MNATTQEQEGHTPAWLAVITGLAAAALLITDQAIHPLLPWWAWPLVGLAAMGIAAFVTVIQMDHSGQLGWFRVLIYRLLLCLGFGVWTTWVDVTKLSVGLGLGWLGGTAALAAVGAVCPSPRPAHPVSTGLAWDRRPAVIRDWEARIRSVTREQVTVVGWRPWDNPEDGFRLYVELPVDRGTTDSDLALHCDKLAAAARLPRGCVVQSLPSDRQGIAILDVMLRDNLIDTEDHVHIEPTTPASINDPFPVLTTPRGEALTIALRIHAPLIGGSTGSGKTTLLHRIIMWLARCTDTLLWVVDLNGGGVATPWIEPWARGETPQPVVDWVADDEEEMAVMVAVAAAIARDRKSNRAARDRKRARNTNLLPVGPDMPAIVVLADEGGEIRQALSLLGQFAANGLTRLAQIGRAEAVRPIISILRGTSDLMDKAHRVQCSIRLCLRMNEHGEYAHVLDSNPPKTPLTHAGAGYLKTTFELTEPVYGRTVNVDEDAIERHAIACGHLRPELDEYGVAVAARLTPAQVTGGKDFPDLMKSRVMRDVRAGKAYTGRWERYAAKLAEMRGEVYDEPADQPTVAAPMPARFGLTSSLDALEAGVAAAAGSGPAVVASSRSGSESNARIIQFPVRPGQTLTPTPQPATAREQILALVRSAGTAGLAASDIEGRVQAARSRVYDLLKQLRQEGLISQNTQGLYVLPASSQTTTSA